ncbi:MAG: glycerol kinase GlpK [Pirellulales bacterium]
MQYILALDQGTTSSRAIVFDRTGRTVASAQREFPQLLPRPGHVEHDPEAIWSSQVDVARTAVRRAGLTARDLAAVGIANQRETTVLWDRRTGRAVAPAIVWQSRASAEICERLKRDGCEPLFREKTGLVVDAYFSGTKIRYLLDSYPALQSQAERGEILFGTIDSFLTWRLTGGRRHVIDTSNASRTLLLDLATRQWDETLLRILEIPRAMLPEVVDTSGVVGETVGDFLGAPVPLAALAGDQQAATFGQNCFTVGSAKNTYGTGCFLLMNTGSTPVRSTQQLLSTIGWTIQGQTTYCLEGSVFVAGAVVQWLRDGLGLIRSSAEMEGLARSVPDSGGVYLVPAFTGLGAPHWDPWARGAVFGLERGTTAGHLARAALESMAFQTLDLLQAMEQDAQAPLRELKVDGGAAVNSLLMQFQADLLGVPVRRPVVTETTALGAAYLAGLAVGYWEGLDDIAGHWQLDREFSPQMSAQERAPRCMQWQEAVRRSRGWLAPRTGDREV